MKLLLDQNISHKFAMHPVHMGPEMVHVRDVGLSHADDRTIWQFAKSGDFVLITLDFDYSDLAALHGQLPKIILLRCGNQSTLSVWERIILNWPTVASIENIEADMLEIF